MKRLFLTGDSNLASLKQVITNNQDVILKKFDEVLPLATFPFLTLEHETGFNPVDHYLSRQKTSFKISEDEKRLKLKEVHQKFYSADFTKKLKKIKPKTTDVVLHVGREFSLGQKLLAQYGDFFMKPMPNTTLPEHLEKFQGLKFLPEYPHLPFLSGPYKSNFEQGISSHGLISWDVAHEIYTNLAKRLLVKTSGYIPKTFLIEGPPPTDKVATLFWGKDYVKTGNYLRHIENMRSAFSSVFTEDSNKVFLNPDSGRKFTEEGFAQDKFLLDIPDIHVNSDYFQADVEQFLDLV